MERLILPEEDNKTRLPSPAFTSLASNSSDSDTTMMGTRKWPEDTATCMGIERDISIGIDVDTFLSAEQSDLQGIFAQRNFTAEERAIAERSADPKCALTCKWSTKEAVFKSLGVQSKGAGAAMKDIEVLSGDAGEPIAKLHRDAHAAAQEKDITDIQLSLSYSDDSAIAVALAVKGSYKKSQYLT